MRKTNCEVCNEYTYVDRHHIISRSKAGSTNKQHNIAYLCPTCHRKVHSGSIILEGHFLTTIGFRLLWHKKGECSITGNKPEVHLIK